MKCLSRYLDLRNLWHRGIALPIEVYVGESGSENYLHVLKSLIKHRALTP